MKTLLKILALAAVGATCNVMTGKYKNEIREFIVDIIQSSFSMSWSLLALGGVLIFIFGFIMLHIILYLFLPLSSESRAILFFVLSGIYIIVPIASLLGFYFYHRRQSMR